MPCSELESELRGKTQQLSSCQLALSEAQEDLARDEVIFAGKLKELREMQSIAQQLHVCVAYASSHRVPYHDVMPCIAGGTAGKS